MGGSTGRIWKRGDIFLMEGRRLLVENIYNQNSFPIRYWDASTGSMGDARDDGDCFYLGNILEIGEQKSALTLVNQIEADLRA